MIILKKIFNVLKTFQTRSTVWMKKNTALLIGEDVFVGENGRLVLKLLKILFFMVGGRMPTFCFFVRTGFRLEKGKLQFLALIHQSSLFSDNLDISSWYNTFDYNFSWPQFIYSIDLTMRAYNNIRKLLNCFCV